MSKRIASYFLLFLPLTAIGFQDVPVEVTPRANRIHQSTFVFDGHNDLPYTLRKNASSSFEKMDISKPQPSIHTDILTHKADSIIPFHLLRQRKVQRFDHV